MKQPPTVKEVNYWGFDHEQVSKKLSGDLTYIRTFCVRGEYLPVAVYRAAKPDKSKGHKKYVLLNYDTADGKVWVRGMTAQEMAHHRRQQAVLCEKCNQVIYSVYRHCLVECDCRGAFIDGGKDYTRFTTGEHGRLVTLELITGRIIPDRSLARRSSAGRSSRDRAAGRR